MKKPKTNSEDTELLLAVFKADRERARSLIKSGADVNAIGDRNIYSVAFQTPLGVAIGSAGQEATAVWQKFSKLLPEFLPEVGHRDFAAIRAAYLAIAKDLLDAGADPNRLSHGRSPLSIATYFGDLEAVRLLLHRGADPTAISVSPLSKLSKRQKRRITEPGYYDTALHEAAEKGNLDIVKALVAAGADVLRADHEDRTPLQVAQAAGQREVIEFLTKVSRSN